MTGIPLAVRKRRPAKPRAPTETQEHKTVAAYFRKIGLGGNAVARHIRNERAGDWARIEAARMGVAAGVPDWLIVDGHQAGFIEMKPRGWRERTQRTGTYTRHELRQLEEHRTLKLAGAWVEICETLEEVLDALRRHGVPLRAESLTTERIKRGFAGVAA